MTRRARLARWALSAVCGLAVALVVTVLAISGDADWHDVWGTD